MARKPHVLIVGAGMGGLFLAQFLRKRGIPFDIFEREASPTARYTVGWAIGFSMLDDLDSEMLDDVPRIEEALHLLPLDLPSQAMLHFPNGTRIGTTDTPETPVIRANRKKLRQQLQTGITVQWGKKAVRHEEDKAAKTVTVWFDDGTSATGDLLIGVDGTWSKIRESVLGKSNSETVEAVPMSMIWGLPVLHGEAFEKQLRLGYSACIAMHPANTFFCGLDRVSADGQTGNYYWFLYLPDDKAGAADNWLRTATTQEKYDVAIKRSAILDPKFSDIIRAGGPEAIVDDFHLFYDAVITSVPKGSRTLLIGDSAHPTTPFRGEGGVMAIKDALQLSQILDKIDIDDEASLIKTLDDFQQEVLDRGSKVVQLSRDVLVGNKKPPGAPVVWGFDARPYPEPTEPLLTKLRK